MKTILVCGSRYWQDDIEICAALEHYEFEPGGVRVIHGDCRGADRIAGRIAEQLGMEVEPFSPEYERYGKAATHIRNAEMLDQHPDVVLAFGVGAGTDDVVKKARAAGIEVVRYGLPSDGVGTNTSREPGRLF
jgi:hypothetical protein